MTTDQGSNRSPKAPARATSRANPNPWAARWQPAWLVGARWPAWLAPRTSATHRETEH